jgi:hypothetical protein
MTLDADLPISSASEDRFGRAPFAKRLADILARADDETGLVVGIHGRWGSGKSSVLQMVREALREQEHVTVAEFNPWLFDVDPEGLLRHFFATVSAACRLKPGGPAFRVGKMLAKYGNQLSGLGFPVQVQGTSLGSVSPGQLAATLGEALTTQSLEDQRRQIEDGLQDGALRVVVFVDDVDRLDNSEVQALFRIVKLVANFRRTVFVMAFDARRVAAALGTQFAGGTSADGAAFLEKVVQVPLSLPAADTSVLRSLCLDAAFATLERAEVAVTERMAEEFVKRFDRGLLPSIATPRDVSRYRNAIHFAVPLLKGEVHPIDLLLLEGIRCFCTSLYEEFWTHDSLFRDTSELTLVADKEAERKRQRDEVDSVFRRCEIPPTAGLHWLSIQLFPRLETLYKNHTHSKETEEEWTTQKRVCSEEYFPRFFSYGIPRADIADADIERLLEAAGTGDEGEVIAMLSRVPVLANTSLVAKVRRHEDSLEAVAARTLLLGMAAAARGFRIEPGVFGLISDGVQVALMSCALIRRLPEGDRVDAATSAVLKADALTLSHQLLIFLARSLTNGQSVLHPDGLEAVEKSLLDRVRSKLKTEPLHEWSAPDAVVALSAFASLGSTSELEEHLRPYLEQDAARVAKLLLFFAPRGTEFFSGQTRPHLTRKAFEEIGLVVSVDFLNGYVSKAFGNDLGAGVEYPPASWSPEKSVASQFVFLRSSLNSAGSATANGA